MQTLILITNLLQVLLFQEPTRLASVVRDDSANPVARAHVFILSAKPYDQTKAYCPTCYPECGRRSITNAQGQFLFEDLNPKLLYSLLIVADGFEPAKLVDASPGGQAKVAL